MRDFFPPYLPLASHKTPGRNDDFNLQPIKARGSGALIRGPFVVNLLVVSHPDLPAHSVLHFVFGWKNISARWG